MTTITTMATTESFKQQCIGQIQQLLNSQDYHNWLLAIQLMRGQQLTQEILGFDFHFDTDALHASGLIDVVGLNFLGQLIEKYLQQQEQNEQVRRKLLMHTKEIFTLIAAQNPTPQVNFTLHILPSAYKIQNQCPIKYHFFTPTKKPKIWEWWYAKKQTQNWWENTTLEGIPAQLLRSTFVSIDR